MISDIRSREDGATIETDLCIIGGGPAAIAIARELSSSNIRVCILESGGLNFETKAQSLAGGTKSGIPYFDLEMSRYRMLGGSTFRWGARSAPMLPIDFERRPWLPYSGWPISIEDLGPYYARVEDLAGWHVPFAYDERVWDGFHRQPPAFDRDKLQFCAFQFGKIILFGEYYKKFLERASNTEVWLHATATRLNATGGANHVDSVDLKTYTGEQYRVRARYFVLAGGGIENARILLRSNDVNPKGLCNERDVVGRFFMEHPTVSAGSIEVGDWRSLHDIFSPGMVGGRLVETGLALSPQLQEAEQCLNGVTTTRLKAERDSTQALRELVWHARHRKLPSRAEWYVHNPFLMERFGTIMRDPFGIPLNLLRHVLGKPKRFKIESIYLELRIEQEPNPESRVTLSSETDAIGEPYAHLHWDLTERERHTMRVAARTFAAELERLGLGKLETAPWLQSKEQVWSPEMVGGHHHMGTTRMSETPDRGVVDSTCRAHTVDNLYIAGSSVFPTCSFVNPTPTLLALAVRLADHLRVELRQEAPVEVAAQSS